MAPNCCEHADFGYARAVARSYLSRVEPAVTDESPLVRQWILLRTLCARRYGKTIRRDLETFHRAGFPLEETVGDYGRKTWHMDPARTQPGMTFTFDEAVALYLGRRFLEPLAGTLFWEAAQRAFKKLRATLGPGALKYIDRFGGMFHQTMVGAGDYSKKAEIIDQLMLGIEDSRAVFITYQSLQATEPVTYDIYPYGLSYHRGSLYLVGWAPQHEEIRHWKVDRIEDAEVTEFPFQRPKDFDLHEHFARSFGVFRGDGEVHVKVRFAPEVARYVQESKWHPSQRLSPQPDGSLVAEFDLDGTEEIKRWVLSFGRYAEVVEPEELREEMVYELRGIIQRYGSRAASHRRES